MKARNLSTAAFTLIELLVVITIIGILAGIAIPALNNARMAAEQARSTANAKAIGLGLKMFASDNDGYFPRFKNPEQPPDDGEVSIQNANEGFRQLVPGYVETETPFGVKGSKFILPNKPDNKYDDDKSPWDDSDRLRAGENHWAYVAGLSESSRSDLPLVADGFANLNALKYSKNADEKGGVWKGRKAIVLRVDYSAELMKVNSDLTIRRPGYANQNFFKKADDWIPDSARILNPQ